MMTKKSSEKGRLTERWMPLYGRVVEDVAVEFTRRRAVPDTISVRNAVTVETMTRPKPTKLLLNVTVQRSLVPLHVLISPESTVGDIIAAALRQYSKEGRRPIFPSLNPPGFDLHYSQFCLERLSRDEKLIELGSRNFFLCPKQEATVAVGSGGHGGIGIGSGYDGLSASLSTCSEEKVEVMTRVWFRFMEFML